MNILLMLPLNRSNIITPSLGLGYLASVLRQNEHKVSILHCIKEKTSFEDFENYIKNNNFDAIGIQMFTYDFNNIKKYAKIIKQNTNSISFVGGYHPSGDPIGTLENLKDIDYAFVGEAEIGLPIFIKNLNKLNKNNLEKIPNLVWRDKDKIIVNKQEFVENLDSLPYPAWDLMDPREFPEAPHGAFIKSWPTAPIIITRGCPFQCTFCAGKTVTGNKVRKRSIVNVLDEIKFLMNNYGVKEFLIEDENFTFHKDLVLEFCNKVINQKLDINWSCPSGVRLDTLDEEMLQLMEKSGCHSLSVGIEFGSQRILDLTKKKLTLEKIKEKVDLFRKTKIKVTGFFMMGYPTETKEDIEKTIKFSKQLKIDRAQFNSFMPLPGSEIYNKLLSEGKLNNLDYNHFFVHDVSYIPEGLTENDMRKLRKKAFLSFYLRPKIILGLLKDIKNPKHFKFLFKRFFDSIS